MSVQRVVLAVSICSWGTAAGGTERIRLESVGITLLEKADVPAREAGVLAEVLVREGKQVAAGEALAQLDDLDGQLQLKKARIQRQTAAQLAANDVKIRLARKALELAEVDMKRAQESIERFPMSVTQSQLDRLKLEIEQGEREIEAARLALESAENDVAMATASLERRKIVAPIAGTVVELKRRKGEWVQPGETVVRLLRIDRLRAEGFLQVAQLRGDLTGRPVVLQVALPDGARDYPGVVTFVSPEANPVNGQVRVLAEVENPDRKLRPGLVGTLLIEGPAANPAIKGRPHTGR